MAQTMYYVVRHQGAWKIQHDNRHEGLYSSRGGAVRAAITAAYKAAKEGKAVQVLTQSRNKWQTEWAY